MKYGTPPGSRRGFGLISIVLALGILCILAVMMIPRYLGDPGGKDKAAVSVKGPAGPAAVPEALAGRTVAPGDAANVAGMAALAAAASNVQAAYTKLVVGNPSGGAVTSDEVAALLNSGYTAVGDYIVSYTPSGRDKIIARLQPGSRGKYGTPDSREIVLAR
ncbi:MAG TPA: hypothetical protein PLO63_10830 [Syntrophales bacterium]|nr:hypothetical protein [Syntrophales bacterium]